MGNLVCIWVSRLKEWFYTKRWQRDCPLYVFSSISLNASRQGERRVTHGAGIGLKGFLVYLFVTILGEILVTLGAEKIPISCMVPLMSLQATRRSERHVSK